MNLSSTYKFENDPTTKNKVENRFEDSDDHLGSVLSRNDWEGTFPQSPTDADKVLSTETKNKLKSTDSGNPLQSADASTAQMPVENQKTTLDLSQMNDVDYNDAKWDTLLNATSASDCLNMIDVGAFHSKAITSIGKPKTNEADGPAGFTNFMGDPAFPSGQTCFYCSEVVVASTWNLDLAYDEGICVGEEGIFGDTEGATKMTYSGWYAPGVNLHRSPFAGRTAEYYSEDPVLSGKMAANIVKGCKDRGVYAYVKHFALNEQETNRDANGDITWCTEQAMRELYFKPFEIAVKEGGATAIMSSFNRIGTKWTGGDYRLLTQVLREEWGFQGSVITDFNVKNYMNLKQMIYAGGDLNLASQPKSSQVDLNNANDVKMVKRAAKNVLYTVANSNAFNVVVTGYKTAYWIIIMWCIEAALFTGLTTWGVFAFLKAKKKFEKEAN